MQFTPTPSQQSVLNAPDDLLVVGPPGTGKTTIALEKTRRFVLEHNPKDYQQVLFLSFSNAAVNRIHEAAKTAFGPDVRPFVTITTFHAFCHRFLSAHWRLAGLGKPFSLLPSEEEKVLKTRYDDAEAFKAEIRHREIENGQVTYDRFAPLVADVLGRVKRLRETYSGAFPLVIADEYQDTDDDQHVMVSLLAQSGQLICLGDPDQRIYDFRPGIRPDRLNAAEHELQLQRIEFEGNHRSGNFDVLDLARAVRDEQATIPKPESATYWRYHNNNQLSDHLKRAIVALERHVRKETGEPEQNVSIAIMAYGNNFVERLSSILKTPTDRFNNPFLHSVSLPPDQIAIAWDTTFTVLEPRLSVRGKTAHVLQSTAALNRLKGKKTHIEQAERLERWARELQQRELSGHAKGVWTLNGRIGDVILDLSGNPKRDTRRVREAFTGIPGKHLKPLVDVLSLRPIAASMNSVVEQLATTYADTGEYLGARQIGKDFLLQERMKVTSDASAGRVLMTMHKCKGKEFDAVILVDRLHVDGLVTWDERDQTNHPKSRRLLYVALSRARYAAIILTPDPEKCPVLPTFTNP